MIEADRRSILKAGAVIGTGLFAPSLALAAEPAVAVFIVDARFAASLDAAAHWQRQGAMVLDPRDIDLGQAWRDAIPRQLRHGGIAGLTLWSDYFICETFAREAGLRPRVQARRGPELFRWALG